MSDPFSSPPHWGGSDPYSSGPGGPFASGQSSPAGPGGHGQGPTSPYGQPAYGQTSPFGQTSPYGQTLPHGQGGFGTDHQPAGAFGSPPGSPPGPPGGGYGGAPPPPPRGRRGLVIGVSVLAAVLVLCLGGAGGAFLLLRDTDTDGAESPTAAVQAFLQAVYRDLDASRAADLVCSEARDESALRAKIEEIAAYQNTYLEPRFTWTSPELVGREGDLAFIETTVTMMTGDEKTSELHLRVSVLDKGSNGWWVCDLTTTVEPPASEGESGAPGEDDQSGEDGASGGSDSDEEGGTQT